MASINCEGGIQDSICLPSNIMETQIIKYKPSRSQAVNEAANKFLLAGIIKIMQTQSEKYLSKFFMAQESTKRRPILDYQRLN